VLVRAILLTALGCLAAAALAAPGSDAPPAGGFGPGGLSAPSGPGAFGGAALDGQQVAVHAGFTQPAADGTAQLFITATIQPGWHISSITQPRGGPKTTKILLDPSRDYTRVGDFQATPAPDAKHDPIFEMRVETHEGTVAWRAPIRLSPGVDPARLKIRGAVDLAVCLGTNRCEPKNLPWVAALSAAEAAAPAPASPTGDISRIDLGKLLVQLWFAYWGGMILNFMPCVLPVISLKLLSFLEQAGESRARVFALNAWYSLGLISVFMILAVLAATAGQAWGEQFTLPWFKVALAAVVFAMALSFLGVWEIPIPGFMGRGRANALQAREGASGAFFKGVFATVLATPCSGPLLGPTFAYVLTQHPAVAYGIFAAMGLGMATPYLVLGAFPSLLRYLPRPGAWMETFKQVMAFLLLGTVVYLFTTLRPAYFIPTLTLLVGVWFGAWLIGRTPLTVGPVKRAIAWAAAICSAALVGTLAFTLLLTDARIAWQPYSPAALAAARREGKTVLIDFSANWCLTCKWNLKMAVETEKVHRLIEQNEVVPLLADWTDESPMIKRSLNALGYNSIPLLVVYPADAPDNQKPIILPDTVWESDVLEALKKAGPSRPAPQAPPPAAVTGP
jgi:thiol:disulfide interchange protein